MTKFTKQDVADFLQRRGMRVEKFGEKKFDRLFNKNVCEVKVTHTETGVGENCLLDANATEFILGSEERDELVYYSSNEWTKFLIVRHPENIPYYQAIIDEKIQAKTDEYKSKRAVLKSQLDRLNTLYNADITCLKGLKNFADEIKAEKLTK